MINFINRLRCERGSTSAGVVGIVVAILVVVLVIFGGIYWIGSTASAEPNKTCVVYSGGTFTDKKFQEILPAGSTNKIIGWGSTSRCYYNDQRSYIGSNKPGADTTPVSVTCRGDDVVVDGGAEAAGSKTSSQINVTFDYNAYFTLNTAEKPLVAFDRELGRKRQPSGKDATSPQGWKEMLAANLEPQITRAMEDAATPYSCLDLVGDTAVRAEYQKDVIKLFRKYLDEVVKGDYFCGPNYDGAGKCTDISFKVSNPTLPAKIRNSIEARIEARQATATQRELNRTAEEKLDIDDELIKRYGPQGALVYKAIESGKVTFYVLPDGTTVPAPNPGK